MVESNYFNVDFVVSIHISFAVFFYTSFKFNYIFRLKRCLNKTLRVGEPNMIGNNLVGIEVNNVL